MDKAVACPGLQEFAPCIGENIQKGRIFKGHAVPEGLDQTQSMRQCLLAYQPEGAANSMTNFGHAQRFDALGSMHACRTRRNREQSNVFGNGSSTQEIGGMGVPPAELSMRPADGFFDLLTRDQLFDEFQVSLVRLFYVAPCLRKLNLHERQCRQAF